MYFLFPLFGIEAIAVAEVPINIGQMTIGSIIAIPINIKDILSKHFHV